MKVEELERKLVAWFRDHDEVKVDRVSVKAGMPQKCLARVVSGKAPLPRKHVPRLRVVLGRLGFEI
jgi:hypothetical protein